MRFYYFSILSLIPLAIYYVLALGALAVLALFIKRLTKPRAVLFFSVALVLVVLPWTEEMWIAYHFDQLCRKDAGYFVYKTVEVEGFYDDTMPSAYENIERRGYRFVEQRSPDRKTVERVERADDKAKAKALEWFVKERPGVDVSGVDVVKHSVSSREMVAVNMRSGNAWRITTLDSPTAGYHYRTVNRHARVERQVSRFEDVVVDSRSGEVLGRYVNYYRGAPWFFLGLDRPTIPCYEPRDEIRKHGSLIYTAVLKPLK